MSQPTQSPLKQNLVWIVGLAICVIVVLVSSLGFFGSKSTPNETQVGKKNIALKHEGVEEKYVKKLLEPSKPPKTLEMEVQEDIAEYEEFAEDDTTSPNNKAEYLFAIGNLTRDRLKDPAKAIQYYERIVVEFPDHQKAALAHKKLFACYKDLGDEENARWVCNEALKKFPPDSTDYQWAQIQLGLIQDPRVNQGTIPENVKKVTEPELTAPSDSEQSIQESERTPSVQ